MVTLPTGTLTLLFSDIEGSTRLLHELGDQWGRALSAHRAIMRTAIAEHDGTEMGTEGDSFFVVFSTAQHAVLAAVAAQRVLQHHDWPDGVQLRVRMGIHTGEPQRHEDGYIGEDVHRAARVGSTAHGAQIVVSSTTRRLLPALSDVTLRDLGHHRLKDLPGDDQLYDVVVPGLISEFGPLRSLGRVAALPNWAMPLVGREQELATATGLVAEPGTRLLTLTGPGGSGKTRLGVAAAAELAPGYPDGVYFVDLSAVDNATVLWTAIADALDVGGDVDPRVAVVDRLRERRALLVLDNVEQIPGADVAVSALLAGAPRIDLLACSRRPLLLVGERELPLDGLALPASSDSDAMSQSPAVDLFVRHARSVRPSFELTADNCDAVARLVRRLDGLPLALELAAAQLRLLSPSGLLTQLTGSLGHRFGAGDRPARQRTLDDVIGWSYDLLSLADQVVFRRLGVFEGPVELDAVAAVSVAGNADETTDAVARLVTASVVRVVDGTDHEPRVTMLQTIRAFARDRLDESDDATAIRTRHLTWCAETVEQAVPLLGSRLHTVARDRLDAVADDIRAALRFALDAADADVLAAGHQLLVTVTTKYWYRFGRVAEARQWQERALSAGDDRDSDDHLALLFGLGVSLLVQGALPAAVERLTQSLEMSRRLGQRDWQARILNALAVARRQRGDFEVALDLLRSSLEIAQTQANDDIAAKALGNLSVLHYDLGDYEQAARTAAESLRLNTVRGDNWSLAIDHVNHTAAVLQTQGGSAAAALIKEWLPVALGFGETELTTDVVELAGSIAAALGDAAAAARLLAAADARRAALAMSRSTAETGRVDAWVAIARRVMPASQWQAAYDAGADLSIEQVGETIGAIAAPVTS